MEQQIEILRELLQRVTAIEEKIAGGGLEPARQVSPAMRRLLVMHGAVKRFLASRVDDPDLTHGAHAGRRRATPIPGAVDDSHDA
jgi:hypothetical protein